MTEPNSVNTQIEFAILLSFEKMPLKISGAFTMKHRRQEMNSWLLGRASLLRKKFDCQDAKHKTHNVTLHCKPESVFSEPAGKTSG